MALLPTNLDADAHVGKVVELAAAVRVRRRRLATFRGKKISPTLLKTQDKRAHSQRRKKNATTQFNVCLYPYVALLPTDLDADAHAGTVIEASAAVRVRRR